MSRHGSGKVLSNGAMRVRALVVGAVVLVLALALGISALTSGSDSELVLRATFKDASPLLEGNDVRLGGVKVGSVDTMRVVEGGAEVTIELDRTALPVHEDARLTIRPVSLLGERYVELDRGSPESPVLADGARLGPERTGSSVALDEVLTTLDDPTAAGLASMLGALGDGLDGNGPAVRRALKALAPALTDTGKLTTILRDQNQTLTSLVDSLSKVASGVAGSGGADLDRLVGSTNALLQQTQINEQAFRAMLAELPSTLRQARRTLGNVETTSDAAVPTLKRLRPTVSDLDEIAGELQRFAEAADPALAALNPVLKKADALIAEARPVARLLREQAPAIRADVEALDKVTKSTRSVISPAMEFVRGWAMASNGRDGLSHYFRGAVVVSPDWVTGNLPSAPSGSITDKQRGGSSGPLQGLTNDVTGALGGLLSSKTDKSGGVTGLTPLQEEGALGFLLGGS